MKTKVSLLKVAAFVLAVFAVAMVSGSGVSAWVSDPVAGVQVTITQEPEGYKGGRPTDNTGSAPFAGLDEGTYIITLKRFNKPTGAYNVAINASGGVKNSVVWDAAKKDTFKTTVTLKGNDTQSLTVLITTADAVASN
jgi:hypothetical protein